MKRVLLMFSILGLTVFGLTVTAHADVLIEPYVGYTFGSFTGGGLANSSTTEKGPEYGARLGYRSIMGLGVGAEYEATSLTLSTNPSDTQTGTDIGPYIELKLPAILRFWGTYFVNSTASVTNSNGSFTGTGTKLGVGITILPLIEINVEMINRNFNKQSGNSLGTDLKDTDWVVGISLPLAF